MEGSTGSRPRAKKGHAGIIYTTEKPTPPLIEQVRIPGKYEVAYVRRSRAE